MKSMERIPRLAAVGDNCMDVYDKPERPTPAAIR